SYLDALLGAVVNKNVSDFFPVPRYDDYQVMASVQLRKDETLEAVFLASDDHLRRSLSSLDPAEVKSENTDSSFYRGFLRYTRLLPDGASVTITPSIGYDSSKSTTKFG